MAGNYLNKFAPGATHLSSPTSATKSAQSGQSDRTRPLSCLIEWRASQNKTANTYVIEIKI
jgi:hypothetical protein